jgi:methylthioribose-1-phosphate isomerase
VIPIERRAPDEIARFREARLTPEAADVDNPAFDVTPAEMVTAIVTDMGVFSRPYRFRGSRDQGRLARSRPTALDPSTP